MSGWTILAIVLVVLIALAVGGAIAARRRMEQASAGFSSHLESANVDLATAHAADRGWDPDALGHAARAAVAERHPELSGVTLTLVEVVDRPGIEDDVARYRARAQSGAELLVTLVRREGGWQAERIEG